MVCLFNRSGRTPGGAYHPGVQQGRLPGADGLSGRMRQAHQHRHGQGGCRSDVKKKRWRRGFVCGLNTSVKLLISVFMCRLCLKVVGSFSVDGGKAKASKDDEETNSVESVGFCNT